MVSCGCGCLALKGQEGFLARVAGLGAAVKTAAWILSRRRWSYWKLCTSSHQDSFKEGVSLLEILLEQSSLTICIYLIQKTKS
jgi:hypothetical protein